MILPSLMVVINRKNSIPKKGLHSIHLRVTLNRVSKYQKIQIPQKVALSDWSGKENAWVKSTHPFAFEINEKIREKINAVHDLTKRFYTQNKSLSFDDIFNQLRSKGDGKSFLKYMERFIADPPEILDINTIKKYNTCLSHLRDFKSQIHFNNIDNELIKNFQKHLQVKLGLEGSTCKKYMEAFKKVIRQARKESFLEASQMEFLFDDVKIKVNKAKRTFLEVNEIKAWKALTFTREQQYLERDRDIFLFQIYTGYYYKDLQIFTKAQLFQDEEYGYFIAGARDKNGNQTVIPLYKFPQAIKIIAKYGSAAQENNVFNRSCFVAEQAYNRNLKEIARMARISKNVYNKVARHTNAQLWVRFGAERQVLSKMMGHTKEETTKHYYDVNFPEIVEGTKRADFEKLGI